MIRSSPREARYVAAASLLLGLATIAHYARLNLLLSHYDARAHLVVARRIIDSLSPCWEQIGAVWLPLPHLLNALPVQLDAWYRSGASAIVISLASFVAVACAVYRIAERLAGSRDAGVAAAALTTLNPNLLYLQSTPMTEPLCMALATSGVAVAMAAADHQRRNDPVRSSHMSIAAGVLLAAACLTRYEAWPVTAAAAFLLVGLVPPSALVALLALPAASVAGFLVHSKLSTGVWFVAGGFFTPENPAAGQASQVAAQVWGGTLDITGRIALIAAAGALLSSIRSVRTDRRARSLLLPLALIAASALPGYAFFQGHPYRVRYMTLLIPAVAAFASVIPALLPRGRRVALAALVAFAVYENPPWWRDAPMVREAQWDVPASQARRPIGEYLGRNYDGRLILASMGSLGHYMQELSRVAKPGSDRGFGIADFLHEGNGDIWTAALEDPAPHAGWILIDDYSEGGDVLAARTRGQSTFLKQYERVADGAGIVLYRRRPG